MSDKNGVLKDVKNLLEYAKSLGMTEVGTRHETRDTRHETKNKETALENVRKEIGDCKRCKLCGGRQNIVFGVGNPNAELMFVGEGPGAEEDKQGIPFVGRAGQLLTKIIEAMTFKRSEVYIANIAKCLKYNAMVQLGNGKWERIGRLVRQQYKGTVKSIDPNGKIVERRVVGWHASPIADRPVYKLSFKSAKNAGSQKVAIYLTGDHPVLTEKRGYVAVHDLKKSDHIATGQGLFPITKNIVIGMLLGDGHINIKQSRLSFSHSIKQKDYAIFKANFLKNELCCITHFAKVGAGNGKKYKTISCRTLSKRSLRIIRNDFFAPKKRVPNYLAKTLNLMMLAIWFMDDGYMRIRPPRKPSAEIATCAFLPKDLKILQKGLRKLKIKAHIIRNRMHFDVHETVKLSRIIAPYVPKSMRWKLHPDIEKKIPFNPSLYKENGGQDVFYDQVLVKRVKHSGSDKTFFCIDVEETNNFVTTGGVVHNCRPPNNRAPESDEVAACIPFLIKQAEVIKPKIIVCLGSVATQNLLGIETKITKMRGNFTEWQGIPVMPTYHPAFLLRNPAMKKPVWEDMQKVMEMLGRPISSSIR